MKSLFKVKQQTYRLTIITRVAATEEIFECSDVVLISDSTANCTIISTNDLAMYF